MTDFDPDRIRTRLVEVGEEWAELDAAANVLEETRKTILAEIMLKCEGSQAAKEMQALADPSYKLHVTKMVAARKEANRAKVKFETGKMWAELMRTRESTRRAEATIR